MRTWTDEQKEAIYQSGTNIIVSAGAGSGKTAVLTERVIQKIKNGVSLSQLLILTFTNLAAKEMRERISASLKENGFTDELSRLDTADITTFDAYALSLVQKYHYLLNVQKDIHIIDASVIALYKNNILRSLFDSAYAQRDEAFLSLIDTYEIKDDHTLFDYILELDSKLDLKPDKTNYLKNYIEDKFAKDIIYRDIDNYTHMLLDLISAIREPLECIDDSAYLEKMTEVLEPLLNSRSYSEIKNSLDFKLPIARNVSDITKDSKEKISSIISEIKKYTIYESEEDIYNGILMTKPHIAKIIDLILALDAQVSAYKRKYDSYEYHDIANLAITLVRDYPEVRLEIKNNLNEILIDEYQDTSDIQEAFISYIANNNVYMVGDIKQSIYRFRSANPYIFKNKYDNYSALNGGIKIDLNKNFRSREEVISNINLIFNHLMDDTIGGAAYATSHQMLFGNKVYEEESNNQNNNLEVYNYLNTTNYKKEEIEAFIIGQDIKSKINSNYLIFDKKTNKNRPIKYSDIVILMDNRKHFDLYKKILEYLNIPTTTIKKDNLTTSEVIIVLKNILSFIIKIKENIIDSEFKRLFISINRSFIFSLNDETIFDYFLNDNFKSSSLYTISKEISDNIDTMTITDVLDTIIEKYDIYNRLFLIGDYKLNILRLTKLKEITQSLVDLDYTIYDYEKYLKDILASGKLKIEYDVNDENDSSVRIMTIHASKGLEFSLCFYSGLSSKFNIQEAVSKFTYDEEYGIIIPYRNNFLYNTIYHNLSYQNYIIQNVSEKIRLFYVALTRAKEKMIFVLPSSQKEQGDVLPSIIDTSLRSKYNSFASIVYSLEPIIKNNYRSIDLETLGLTKDYNMIKGNNYSKVIKKTNQKIYATELETKTITEDVKTFSKKNYHLLTPEEESKLSFGVKAHELLELTDLKNPDYRNLSPSEKEIITNFLKNINIQNSTIYKEYEFVYTEENTTYHGIIDLMLEYPDHIKIIDYKLKNIDDANYIKQLNGYKKYIENTFQKKTEVYLYSIIDNNLKKI